MRVVAAQFLLFLWLGFCSADMDKYKLVYMANSFTLHKQWRHLKHYKGVATGVCLLLLPANTNFLDHCISLVNQHMSVQISLKLYKKTTREYILPRAQVYVILIYRRAIDLARGMLFAVLLLLSIAEKALKSSDLIGYKQTNTSPTRY